MDQRLKPHMTQAEFDDVIGKCSTEIRKQGRRGRIVVAFAIPLAMLSFFGFAGRFLYKPPYQLCAAPQGECSSASLSPSTHNCCRYWCCSGDLEMGNVDFASEGTCSTTDVERHADGSVEMECRCTRKGKTTVCDAVHIEGEAETVPAENEWAQHSFVFNIVGAVGVLSFVAWFVHLKCTLKDNVAPHFEAWERKGLKCRYFAGSKHSRARIFVEVPSGMQPMVMGGAT